MKPNLSIDLCFSTGHPHIGQTLEGIIGVCEELVDIDPSYTTY